MTVASDLCRCGGAPLKIPPNLGVQRILSWAGAGGLRPMTKKKLHHKHDEEEKVTGCKAHISSLRGLLQLQPALVAQCHLETWQRHQRHSGSP